MINYSFLERLFILPNVRIFLSNKEHSDEYPSSLENVGGCYDVEYNIQYVYMHRKKRNEPIIVKDFYRKDTNTIIEIRIGGVQENINKIFKRSLDRAILDEIISTNQNWYHVINFFEDLLEMVCVFKKECLDLIKLINRYLDFVQWIIRSTNNRTNMKIIKEKYDQFRLHKFVPREDRVFYCDIFDLYEVLGEDADIIYHKKLYPSKMIYENDQIYSDIDRVIGKDCYRIDHVTININIADIDIDTNDNVCDFCDKVFSTKSASILHKVLSKYKRIDIISYRDGNGDIIIQFVNRKHIIVLAKLTPNFETIIWPVR